MIWFKESFLDYTGKVNYVKLTVFVSFVINILMWIGEQFFLFKVPEYMFMTFSGIVVSGMFKNIKDGNVETNSNENK